MSTRMVSSSTEIKRVCQSEKGLHLRLRRMLQPWLEFLELHQALTIQMKLRCMGREETLLTWRTFQMLRLPEGREERPATMASSLEPRVLIGLTLLSCTAFDGSLPIRTLLKA